MIESSNGKDLVSTEGSSDMEPYVGMDFDSEEAAKVFYDAYATRMGFIMRVDAFRRSMRDGKVVWRRLVCNKEGFRKLRPKRSENRKPRAITREGCKAMIVVKKEKTGKWVVTRFVKEHNHPLVVTPANGRRSVLLSQTPGNDGFDGNGGAHGRGLGYGFHRWWQDGFLMEVCGYGCELVNIVGASDGVLDIGVEKQNCDGLRFALILNLMQHW
uniref:FAR1 domain-containing protein n=1 Tax=Quercus lobata TaxID=97700 RepID=A0A7N2RBA1_QUELO